MAITGLILAGGRGSRMGGVDKGLQVLRGKPMIEWVLARFAPQVNEVLINANQNVERYARLGRRVVPDDIGGYAGPLAGLHAGLQVAAHPLVATCPCDSPFLPPDLVARLRAALERDGADLAVAETGQQPPPVVPPRRRQALAGPAGFPGAGGRK